MRIRVRAKLYADRLAAQAVIAADEADKMVATFRQAMDGGTHTNADDPRQFQAAIRGGLVEI